MKVNLRDKSIRDRIGIISIYLAGIILLLMAADSCVSGHGVTALMLGLPGIYCLCVGFYISKMPAITGRHISASDPSEDSSELQVASAFMLHLGFPDATVDNARRVAALLELMAAACDIVTPGEETDEQDARQLAIQIEGMSERIAQLNTKG